MDNQLTHHIVCTMSLLVPLRHRSGFVHVYFPIHVGLLLEDPFTPYCLFTRFLFNQVSGLIIIHGLHLDFHSLGRIKLISIIFPLNYKGGEAE